MLEGSGSTDEVAGLCEPRSDMYQVAHHQHSLQTVAALDWFDGEKFDSVLMTAAIAVTLKRTLPCSQDEVPLGLDFGSEGGTCVLEPAPGAELAGGSFKCC